MMSMVGTAMINPISGRTLEEEILIGLGIGGRLPFDFYVALIRRGVVKPHKKNRRPVEIRRKQKNLAK